MFSFCLLVFLLLSVFVQVAGWTMTCERTYSGTANSNCNFKSDVLDECSAVKQVCKNLLFCKMFYCHDIKVRLGRLFFLFSL